MPAGVVKTQRDEQKWKKAKGIIKRQYPSLSEESDNFWALVNSIYQNMKKSISIDMTLMKAAVSISFLCPETPKDMRSFSLENYFLICSHTHEMMKAIGVKQHYSSKDLQGKGLRWVTVRGNHVLVQGLQEGGYVVVGGAGGKLNHLKIDKLLSPEEYKIRARERKKAEVAELSPAQIKEAVAQRKEEVGQKRAARSEYESTVKTVLGIADGDFKSLISAKQLDEIEDLAMKKVRKNKHKDKLDEGDQPMVEEEKQKMIEEQKKAAIKNAEKKALDVLAGEFFGDKLDPNQKNELKASLDAEKAMQILKARQAFRKKVKAIGTTKIEKEEEIKIGDVLAVGPGEYDEKVLEEVKQNIETNMNVQLYDTLNAQQLKKQDAVDLGVLSTLNGLCSDLFSSPAVFGKSTIENLGVDACVSIMAERLIQEGKGDIAKEALVRFAQKNNMKTVDGAMKESARRFKYAEEIRKMAIGGADDEAILSLASANGYALRQTLRAQQVLGSAVGSLRGTAHLINRLEEGSVDTIQVDMGKDLARARRKAKSAGFDRGTYKMMTREGRFVMEIPKENLSKFFETNIKNRGSETEVDKIKMHEENTGYVPEGMAKGIKLDESQEAGLRFFKEQGKVLLDFEAGMGKTAVAYAAAMEAMNNMGAKKILICVPASLRSQFYQERKKFLDKDRQDKVILNDQGPDRRKENYKKNEGIMIIGHDQLRTDYKEIKEAGFGMMVVDEVHEITNPEIKSEQDSGRMRGMTALKDIPYKIAMSGTNIKNSKKELYKKINFIDPDHTLGTIKDFEEKYKGLNQGTSAFTRSENDSFRRAISPWVYTQKSHLKVRNDIKEVSVPLSKEQKKNYKASEEKYILEKQRGMIGAASRKESRNYDVVHDGGIQHNSKAMQTIKIMEEKHPGEKAAIHVYRRKALASVVSSLEAKYGKGSVVVIHGDTPKGEATKAKAEFNNPDSKVRFIVGTKSLENGHNLQGGTVTFHLDIPVTASAFEQRNKRIYRRGQTHNVTSYLLRSETPFDFSKMDTMERKGREMSAMGNPSYLETMDEDGFLSTLNQVSKEIA